MRSQASSKASLHSDISHDSQWSEACIITHKTIREPNFHMVTAKVEEFFPMDTQKLTKDD